MSFIDNIDRRKAEREEQLKLAQEAWRSQEIDEFRRWVESVLPDGVQIKSAYYESRYGRGHDTAGPVVQIDLGGGVQFDLRLHYSWIYICLPGVLNVDYSGHLTHMLYKPLTYIGGGRNNPDAVEKTKYELEGRLIEAYEVLLHRAQKC